MPPTVSVICLCYNHEAYVRAAINSILNQTYGDFELLFVDDGSTDNSVALAREFADPRIKVLTTDHRGPGYASAMALNQARGEYVALMSSDDVCLSHRFEAQHKQMREMSLDALFSRPTLIDDGGRSLPETAWPVFFKRSFRTTEDLYEKLFFRGNFLCATSAMIRRDVATRFGWASAGMLQLQDYLLWVRIAPHCRFHMTEDRQLMYRVRSHGANLSSATNTLRTLPEKSLIYRQFFDGAPRDFLWRAFHELQSIPFDCPEPVFEAGLSLLYLRHKAAAVRLIGAERLMAAMATTSGYDAIKGCLSLDVESICKVVDEAVLAANVEAASALRRRPKSTTLHRIKRILQSS